MKLSLVYIVPLVLRGAAVTATASNDNDDHDRGQLRGRVLAETEGNRTCAPSRKGEVSIVPPPSPNPPPTPAPTPCDGAVGDTVYEDINGNRVQDQGELGIKDVTVTISTGATTQTNGNGNYMFTGLCPGTYIVTVDKGNNPPLNGLTQTQSPPGPAVVTIQNPVVDDQDFGYKPAPTPGPTPEPVEDCNNEVGDTVYLDVNGDSTQDVSNEPGISGVTVTLTPDGQTPITRITESNGKYMFMGLCPGTYTVTVDQGNNPPLDGLIPTETPVGRFTINGPNESILDKDFGYTCDNKVGDTVYEDTNGNGTQDSGEPGISGVTVILSEGFTTIGTTQTDPNGKYIFERVCPGTYNVGVNQPANPPLNGLTPTQYPGENTAIVTGPNQEVLDQDFGYEPAPTPEPTPEPTDKTCIGVMGDTVYLDVNGDSTQDVSNEPGIGDVTLRLFKDNSEIGTTQTNDSGKYMFTDLCPGTYTVTVDKSTGTVTPPLNEMTETEKPTGAVITDQNPENLDQDFGFQPPIEESCDGRVGDTVYYDKNGNNIQDLPIKDFGEYGFQDVTLSLFNEGETESIATTTTDQNGMYMFTGLCPGSYVVEVTNGIVLEDKYIPTQVPTGATITSENKSDLNQDFGYKECLSRVGDTVYLDENGDETQDAGEEGIPNVVLALYKDGEFFATSLTDSAGEYIFNELCAGTYRVEVDVNTVPTDYIATEVPTGDAVLTGADENLDQDFGYTPPCDFTIATSCIQQSGCYKRNTQELLETCLCQDKLVATTLMYIGDTEYNTQTTVEFTGKGGDDVLSSGTVDELTFGTVLKFETGPDGHEWTIFVEDKLDAQTNIYIGNQLNEIIHTSCSAIYYAGRPAPLDQDSPGNPEKGTPSPNWWVVDYKEADGDIVEAFDTTNAEFSACTAGGSEPIFFQYTVTNNGGMDATLFKVYHEDDTNLLDPADVNTVITSGGGAYTSELLAVSSSGGLGTITAELNEGQCIVTTDDTFP